MFFAGNYNDHKEQGMAIKKEKKKDIAVTFFCINYKKKKKQYGDSLPD